jgi:hypothetical protein
MEMYSENIIVGIYVFLSYSKCTVLYFLLL